MSETNEKAHVNVRVVHATPVSRIVKSDRPTNILPEETRAVGDWIEPPYMFQGLDALIEHSTILPQCINAYVSNTIGFGIEVDYVDEAGQEESEAMKAEYEQAQRLLDLLSYDCEAKDIFGKIVESRERYGIAYAEIIRNLAGQVVQIETIKDPASIRLTIALEPYQDVVYYYKGEEQVLRKKFRKFKQEINGKTVYFKEFGDPRIMDLRSGEYVDKLELEYQANEILDFPLGDKPYGTVRWIGQMLGIDGAAKAERLNNNYFVNGRHTPMLIMIQGGTLSEDSFQHLTEYMNDIKGESGQHAFMVLETEIADTKTSFDDTRVPTITVKDLSPMLQKDELFQGYMDNVRRKVQSAFLLPDLYVGYTTDFNRATAQTAMEVTEKQVFIPMRKNLAWTINRKLFSDYQFKYVKISFRAPDITNPDDQAKLLNVIERAGGITPNEAHQLAASMSGSSAENYPYEWGNVPLAYTKVQSDKAASPAVSDNIMSQIDSKITKAAKEGSDELVAVMKQVKAALIKHASGSDKRV